MAQTWRNLSHYERGLAYRAHKQREEEWAKNWAKMTPKQKREHNERERKAKARKDAFLDPSNRDPMDWGGYE